MEKSVISAALKKNYSSEEVFRMNPLTLAWIGDAVFSDLIRRYLIAEGHVHVHHLTKLSFEYVCAKNQAKMLHAMMPLLTEKEQDIVRRGRNTKSTPPKHANITDYRYATGLEALCGYLSLSEQKERLIELIALGITKVEACIEK